MTPLPLPPAASVLTASPATPPAVRLRSGLVVQLAFGEADGECRVLRVVEAVHASPPWPARRPKNRYVIIGPAADRDRYVQCLFQGQGDRWAYCEAASGWWRPGGGPLLTTPQRIDLATRGFNTLRFHGNYALAMPTPDADARRRMVRTMWFVLGSIYLRPGEAIGVTAPAVEDDLQDLLASPCPGVQAAPAP